MILLLSLSVLVFLGGALGLYLSTNRVSWEMPEFIFLFVFWMTGVGIGMELCPQRWNEVAMPMGVFIGGCGVLSFCFFRCSLSKLGFRAFSLKFLSWVGLVTLAQLVVSTVWVLLCTSFIGPIEKQTFVEGFLSSAPYERWAFIFVIVVWAPIIEEILMRGFLWEAIRSTANNKIIISGILFGMLHIDNIYSVVPLCIFGIMLGVLRERSGSIWVPMLAHFLNNTIVLVNIALS